MRTAKAQSNKKTIFLTALVVIPFVAALAALLVWYNGQTAELEAKASTSTAPVEKPPVDLAAAQILDRDLVKRMLVHDQQAVELFDIELSRGQSPALKKLVTEIKTKREAQLVTIEGLLKKWGEPYTNLKDYPQQSGHDMYPSHPGMATPEELTKLRAEPEKSVDAKFLELITAHYFGSISMLQQQKDEIIDKEVQSLVRTALEQRSDEQSELDMHQSMHSQSGSKH